MFGFDTQASGNTASYELASEASWHPCQFITHGIAARVKPQTREPAPRLGLRRQGINFGLMQLFFFILGLTCNSELFIKSLRCQELIYTYFQNSQLKASLVVVSKNHHQIVLFGKLKATSGCGIHFVILV